MKKMAFLVLVCLATASLMAQGDATWKSTSTTGFYNDGLNWSTGVMPTAGAIATVSGPGSYTISIPQGGLVDDGAVFMLAKSSALDITFDSTGTWWKKPAANYPQDWRTFGFSSTDVMNNHIFNMETMSPISERGVFLISNAVWRFQCNSQAATNVFESGLFDFAFKGETNRTTSTWMISSSGNPSKQRTIFKAGSHTIFDQFAIRGQAPDLLTTFEGGIHEFYNSVSVKCDSSNPSVPNTYLVFTGSTSNLLYGGLSLSKASGNRGILKMEENAYARLSWVDMGAASQAQGLLIVTNNATAQSFGGDIKVGSATSSKGEWSLGGNGLYRSIGSGTVALATGASSTGIVTVAENARMNFESTQGISIGQNTNILALMTVKDNAQINMTSSGAFGIGQSAATGTLELVDNALLNMSGTGELTLGTAAGAVGVMNLRNTASLTRSGVNNIRIGTANGGTGIVTVAGNSSIKLSGIGANLKITDAPGATGFLNVMDNGVVELNAALSVGSPSLGYGELNLSGNARMNLGTNGTVALAQNNNATGVFNLNDTAVFYATAVNKYFRHGNGVGARAILNINGGVFAATNTIVEPYAYYGEINLNGGESYVGEYRFTGNGSAGTTNKLTVTGGRHIVGSSGMGMGNGGASRNVSLVTVTGGELLSEQNGIRLGIGLADLAVSPIQKLTVTGGRFSTGISAIQVALVNPSFGRVELTGGTVETAAITGGAGAVNQGGTGYASFLADGGKIIFSAAGSNRIDRLDDAQLGAGGLEIVNSSLVTVNQAFTDVSGVDGKIVKNGTGLLTASKTSSHAVTQINAGELKLGSGVTQFGRSLAIASATLSTSDNVSLTTLTVTNGVIKLAGGKKITATTANLSGVLILANGLSVGSYDLIEATNLTVENVVVSGEGATQLYSSDVNNGKLTLTVADAPAPQTKIWQGSGSSWTTVENWNGGTPAKQDTALFNGADPKAVSVDVASNIGTLRFDSSAGYTVSGAKLSVYSGVEAVSGSHTVTAPIEAPYTTNILSLAAQTGASLTVGGALTENQSTILSKTGNGTLKLSGVNALSGAISQEGGVLEFGSAESFGPANSSASAINFKAGTIRYNGADATVTKGFTVADPAGGLTNAFLLDIGSNLTLNGAFQNTKGSPIKIGTGSLTLNFPVDGVYTLASGRGRVLFNNNPVQMDGLPSIGYSGFTVVEGGVVLKGTSSAVDVRIPYQTLIGAKIRQTNLTANASLTVDGCKATLGGSGEHLWVGYGIEAGKPNTPTLNIINGGYVWVDGLRTAGDVSAFVDTKINIMGGSYFYANWAIQFGIGNSSNGKTTVRMSNGVIRCAGATGEFSFGGPLDFVAGSGSAVTQNCTAGIIFRNYAEGTMRFEGGSRLNYTFLNFNNNAGKTVAMQFDNGILQPNLNSMTSRTVRATGLGLELLAGGVTVDMSVVAKHLFTLPIRGAGGLIKTGSGELVFANGLENGVMGSQVTAQYTGLTEVRAGRLSVETNGVAPTMRVKVLAGANLNLSGMPITLATVEGGGMITNGTLTAVMKCTFTNGVSQADALPVFSDVATSGFKVDFGRTNLNPVPVTGAKIAIATVSGVVTPIVSAWRGQNMGNNIFAKFSIESGTVYVTFEYGGTRIILR